MKILRVLSVALTCLASAQALAGVTPGASLPKAETKSIQAVRALLTRCLPPVLNGTPAIHSGLFSASEAATHKLLGDRDGAVWMDRKAELVLIRFHDVPACRVIAIGVNPRILGDAVLRIFDETKTPFQQQRFRIDEGGGFAAVYTAGEGAEEIVIRVSTAKNTAGSTFATLSVERPVHATH